MGLWNVLSSKWLKWEPNALVADQRANCASVIIPLLSATGGLTSADTSPWLANKKTRGRRIWLDPATPDDGVRVKGGKKSNIELRSKMCSPTAKTSLACVETSLTVIASLRGSGTRAGEGNTIPIPHLARAGAIGIEPEAYA